MEYISIEDIREAFERLKRIEEKLDILLDVLDVLDLELDSLDHDPLSYELYRDDE